MIYERYCGSDTTKSVPKRLAELQQNGQKMSCEEKVEVLNELLAVEKEPNTRGFLQWRIGWEYHTADCHEEAVVAFLKAKDEFDPLLGTINGVVDEYCNTLYFAVLGHYAEHNDVETIAELAQIVVVNLDRTAATDFEKGYIFKNLGYSLNMVARERSVEVLRRLALACYLRWHHIEPEDETCLALLAYLYFETGDIAHCRSAVQMCLEVAPAGEVRDRIEAFAREHAHELDPTAGTS